MKPADVSEGAGTPRFSKGAGPHFPARQPSDPASACVPGEPRAGLAVSEMNPDKTDGWQVGNRRRFVAVCAGVGIGSVFFAGALRALAATAPDGEITPEMIDAAAAVAGITLRPEQRESMLAGLNGARREFGAIRRLALPNDVPPAYVFDPVLDEGTTPVGEEAPVRASEAPPPARPPRGEISADEPSLAYLSVRDLGDLLRQGKVTSVALTKMYLERLKRLDARLHCVVNLTEARALARAEAADAELARGEYRGPLHGVPWGAKDLLAVRDYPTTWGAGGFETQAFDEDAVVVRRLDEAGAVLVAKLTLGALAMGDRWFGGRTRNPWNPDLGSSGSSAGSAAAVAAGGVAFAIGSETLGSISSPSTRCGATGYRPTFGFVPRTGAMALSWTMDKLGPIARSAEDCALVMQAIYGPDGRDRTVRPAPFLWDANADWSRVRVGYLEGDFAASDPAEAEEEPAGLSVPERQAWKTGAPERAAARTRLAYDRRFHRAALDTIRSLGARPEPVTLPELPYDAVALLLNAEAAAAFDDLTRSGRDAKLTEQGPEDWPNLFRVARLYPAVEYIQAQRARTVIMRAWADLFRRYDVLVAADSGGPQLTATNLTGHPAVIVPDGLRGADAPPPPAVDSGDDDHVGGPGTPTSLTFLGRLYGDGQLLALAHQFQERTEFHQNRPPAFS